MKSVILQAYSSNKGKELRQGGGKQDGIAATTVVPEDPHALVIFAPSPDLFRVGAAEGGGAGIWVVAVTKTTVNHSRTMVHIWHSNHGSVAEATRSRRGGVAEPTRSRGGRGHRGFRPVELYGCGSNAVFRRESLRCRQALGKAPLFMIVRIVDDQGTTPRSAMLHGVLRGNIAHVVTWAQAGQ